jgi:hypothetical protein
MGMPPVDLASGDKHAPVEPAAARGCQRSRRQRSAWKHPSFWLVRATIETLTPRAAPQRDVVSGGDAIETIVPAVARKAQGAGNRRRRLAR